MTLVKIKTLRSSTNYLTTHLDENDPFSIDLSPALWGSRKISFVLRMDNLRLAISEPPF